jgi:hypothetical protein
MVPKDVGLAVKETLAQLWQILREVGRKAGVFLQWRETPVQPTSFDQPD